MRQEVLVGMGANANGWQLLYAFALPTDYKSLSGHKTHLNPRQLQAQAQAEAHPPPPTCAVKCTNAFNIMKFICSSSLCLCACVCECVSLSKGSLAVSWSCIGSGRRPWARLGARCVAAAVAAAEQTCPTKSSVPRRLTLNFFHLSSAASQVETRIVALC